MATNIRHANQRVNITLAPVFDSEKPKRVESDHPAKMSPSYKELWINAKILL